MKITDLYFGCKLYKFSDKRLGTYNLFGNSRVLYSIATYKVHGYTPWNENLTPEEYKDSLFKFLFGDLWGHVEYEFMVAPMFDGELQKVDLFTMYAEPNKDYLLKLVESVSVDSCKEWLRDYNERRYGKRRI